MLLMLALVFQLYEDAPVAEMVVVWPVQITVDPENESTGTE
jgi:hypothetical protein